MADTRDDAILPDCNRVLHAPGLDTSYRKANPVKFIVNQILHFDDVVRLLDEEAERLTPGEDPLYPPSTGERNSRSGRSV